MHAVKWILDVGYVGNDQEISNVRNVTSNTLRKRIGVGGVINC